MKALYTFALYVTKTTVLTVWRRQSVQIVHYEDAKRAERSAIPVVHSFAIIANIVLAPVIAAARLAAVGAPHHFFNAMVWAVRPVAVRSSTVRTVMMGNITLSANVWAATPVLALVAELLVASGMGWTDATIVLS